MNATTAGTTTEPQALRLRCLTPLVFLLLALAACGGDNLLLPGDGRPAHIAILKGNSQDDTVGHSLPDSLVVKVTDSESRPVEGVEVVFVPPAGAEVAPNDTIQTAANGQAAVHYTLSTTAGEQMVEARAAPIVPASAASVTFRATAWPESAVALMAAGGDGQTAEVSTALPESLAVKAVDRFGNGVAGIEVNWEAKSGGSVSPGAATTGTDGRAATQRTLGDRPGPYPATAAVAGLEGSPVSFAATAMAAPQPSLVLVTEPSSSAAAGVPLEQQPAIQLQDPRGAPLNRKNVNVTVQIASGEGSLGGKTSVKSDDDGRVNFTDLELRGETGSRTLIFAAEGFTSITSGPIMVTAGPPAPGQSSASVPAGGTAGVATVISVHLEDEFGNPVSGAGSRLSVNVAGANPTGGLPVTDEGAGSYSTFYVPIRTGPDLVSVTVDGAPLSGSPAQSIVVAGPADPAMTTAAFSRGGLFGTTVRVVVTTLDAQGNLLGHGGDQVQVQWNGSSLLDATDNGDGTYSRSDFVGFGGVIATILLNGVPIAGSPFNF